MVMRQHLIGEQGGSYFRLEVVLVRIGRVRGTQNMVWEHQDHLETFQKSKFPKVYQNFDLKIQDLLNHFLWTGDLQEILMHLHFEKHLGQVMQYLQNPELETVSCCVPIMGQQGALLPLVFRWVAQAAAATTVSKHYGYHERHEKAPGGFATRCSNQEVIHMTFVQKLLASTRLMAVRNPKGPRKSIPVMCPEEEALQVSRKSQLAFGDIMRFETRWMSRSQFWKKTFQKQVPASTKAINQK